MQTPHKWYYPQRLAAWSLFLLACLSGFLAVVCWLFNMIWPSPILLGLIYGMQDGQPAVTQRNFIPPGKLTDIAVNDDSLFLLYATPGIVNAYSHDGEYQYSILFPYESNGSASLYASGNDLYYCNRWDNVFHVRDGVYQQVWEHDAGEARLANLRVDDPSHQDEVCWYGGMRYEIVGQDVDRVGPDGSKMKIVDGPELLGILEFRTVWLGILLFFVLSIILFSGTKGMIRRIRQASV